MDGSIERNAIYLILGQPRKLRSDMLQRQAAALCLATVLVIGATACGGGGSGRLSKQAYEQKVQAIGAKIAKEAARPSSARSAASEVTDAAAELAALKPPRDAVVDNQKLAAGLRVAASFYSDSRGASKALRSPALIAAAAAVGDLERKGYKLGVFSAAPHATESFASEYLRKVPSWIKRNRLTTKHAQEGAKLFAEIGCLNCHTYLGTGGGYAGAPDLSAEGARGKGIDFQVKHLMCPSCVNRGSPMPGFGALGEKRLRLLADFLEASKGVK